MRASLQLIDSATGSTEALPMVLLHTHHEPQHHHHSPFRRKPLSAVLQNADATFSAGRHLELWDLISIGVGGTVGSGIFVLVGLIAHSYSGPSTCLSFVLSGLAALLSGLCFAECSARIPGAGSTYVYALVAFGEWPAVLAGACLTLEYGVSGAAVAASWGSKVVEWLRVEWQWSRGADLLDGGSIWNPLAGLICLLCVVLLSVGVQESKAVTNFFTLLKVFLVLFMMVGGFWLWDSSNLQPFMPFGVAGTLRGATSSFFAFLGYDEVCCLAAESKHPGRDMPRAVLWTIGIVTMLYILASLALVGMLSSTEISETSGFPAAFTSRGVLWAAQVCAAGEVITLPVVVLISLMAQPRLFAAMALDSLLPPIFLGTHGSTQYGADNFSWTMSNLLCGIPMTLIATFVPFVYLDDCISVGILVAFNMTNTAVIVLKCQDDSHESAAGGSVARSFALSRHLGMYHVVAFGAALAPRLLASPEDDPLWSMFVRLQALLVLGGYMTYIHVKSTKQPSFGANFMTSASTNNNDPPSAFPSRSNPGQTTSTSHPNEITFETPLVPLVPLLGIAVNWYLIAQLEWSGLLFLFGYLGAVSALYYVFCLHHGSFFSATMLMGYSDTTATSSARYDSLNRHESDEDGIAMGEVHRTKSDGMLKTVPSNAMTHQYNQR